MQNLMLSTTVVLKFFRIKALVRSYDGEQSHQLLCALITHNHRVTHRFELDLRCRSQVLAESLQKKNLTVLEALCIEVQRTEQEKSRQKSKCEALLISALEWKGQGAHDNIDQQSTKWVQVYLSPRTCHRQKNALVLAN